MSKLTASSTVTNTNRMFSSSAAVEDELDYTPVEEAELKHTVCMNARLRVRVRVRVRRLRLGLGLGGMAPRPN